MILLNLFKNKIVHVFHMDGWSYSLPQAVKFNNESIA